MSGAAAWSPRGFADFRGFYPATPDVACPAGSDATAAFLAAWDATTDARVPVPALDPRVTVVFVRGLFGTWIPRHLAAPLRALRADGFTAFIAKSRAAGTIDANARMLATDIAQRAPGDGPLLFLCHSKGGLDLLAALQLAPALRRRAAGVVLCQSPRRGCAVLESVLLHEHADSLRGGVERASEALARNVIIASGARPGCLELTGGTLAPRIGALDEVAASVPTLAVATWSVVPSAWLDSQHARLRAIRQQCAHDGLFFLEDLLWPVARQVLLPRVDHSQPCVGGLRFPHVRFWRALVATALAAPERRP